MIIITYVGGQRSVWLVILPGCWHVPRRTAVMAMTALPLLLGRADRPGLPWLSEPLNPT